MKYFKIIVLSGACLSLFASSSFAWGIKGHHLVAEFAKSIMKESTIEVVQNYLGDMSFEDASAWMDEVRSDYHYNYMKPWHYIDIEKGGSYILGNGNNIVDRLNIVCTELKNKQDLPREKINTDLRILFHLVGDLFQPLHVGYGLDRGGNMYQISLNGKGTNLHAVWDTDIIEGENIDLDDCKALYKNLSPAQIANIKNTDFVGSMTENRKLLDSIYPEDHKVDDDYLLRNKIVVEKQLTYAGIKLAAILEHDFGKGDGSSSKFENERFSEKKTWYKKVCLLFQSISLETYLIGSILLFLVFMGIYYYKK